MRLAIILTHPVQYYSPLFRELARRNVIQVKLFYTWEQGAAGFDKGFGKELTWDIPLLDGYEYEFVSNNGSLRKDFWGVKNPGLVDSMEKWGAEAILVFGWNYLSHLRAMRYFRGKIPVYFRGDSNLLDAQGRLRMILRNLFLSWIYRCVDGAFYVGINNKAYYKTYGLKENQLVFAPHAIENKRFHELTADNEAFVARTRQEMELDKPGMTILFVGKFQPKKDPAILIEAVKQLNDPSIRLVMVGSGELEGKLKEMAAGSSNVKFLPFQNQMRMPAIYRLGDVYCLPSRGPGETWGLAVNEAMASGKPILASDKVGCAIDLIHPSQNGYIFQAENIADLKQKIRQLQQDNLHLMAEASKKIIADWTVEQTACQFETILLPTNRNKYDQL